MEESALHQVTLRKILACSSVPLHYLATDLVGAVYLMGGPLTFGETQRTKIGYTRSPLNRIKQLSKRYGGDMWLYCLIWTDDTRYLEARFHDLFSEKHIKAKDGAEWFDLSDEDIDWCSGFQAINTEYIRWYIEEPEQIADTREPHPSERYGRLDFEYQAGGSIP